MKAKIGFNVVGLLILVVSIIGAAFAALEVARVSVNAWMPFFVLVAGSGLGLLLAMAPRVANQWEQAVKLRLGRFVALKGPGIFWVLPLIERVPFWIDKRVRTIGFAAEKTLTKDTVPINVDAVLFWQVTDAEKAALEVANYEDAVAWASQTALRDILGRTDLADILTGREAIDDELRKVILERTTDWGIDVKSVEIRDVVIPAELEDAMSRRAQAERERQARVILGQAESEIAQCFRDAATFYEDSPIALQLRSMNILYEGLKEQGSLMVVPSSMVQSMGGVGGMAGLAAMSPNANKRRKE